MNARDQKKVCDSGFWIIRAGERNGKPIIKAKKLDNLIHGEQLEVILNLKQSVTGT